MQEIFLLWAGPEQILQFEDKIAYVVCDQQLGIGISICFLLVSQLKMWNYSQKGLRDLQRT